MIIEVGGLDINTAAIARVSYNENGWLGGSYYEPHVHIQLITGAYENLSGEHMYKFMRQWNNYKKGLNGCSCEHKG